MGVNTKLARIVPLSDMHIGSPAFDDRKFFRYQKYILDTPDTYCVIDGDVLEMSTKGSVGDVFEGLRPREQRKLAVKYLQPLATAKKILGYVDGNHEARTKKESDEFIGEEICEQLGIPNLYSPDGLLLYLSVGYNSAENKKNRIVYTMFMLHGWSGARTVGGKFGNLEKMRNIVVADLFVCAHTHQKGAFPLRIMVPDVRTKAPVWKKQLFVSCGSFMEYEGYAVRAGYGPTAMGAPNIELCGTRRDFHARV